MHKPIILTVTCLFLLISLLVRSQNVGIGTTTPTAPLSFANQVGNKIVLWGDGNTNHYGIGIQSTFLQLYADLPNSHVVFGHGRSGAFNERVRITNSGPDGMYINGRIHMKNGTNPVDQAYGSGIWLYSADNTSLLGFMGTQNNQNIGFFGGPAGWGLTYNTLNSRVGIGNPNPAAPLSFANVPGRKIVFYQGGGGNVGIGVHNFEYRFHTDVEPADITFGFENLAGQFTERFRLRGNGALAVNGNAGQPGQVLASNGNGAPVTWRNVSNVISGGENVYLSNDAVRNGIPINFSMPANSRLLIWAPVYTYRPCTIGPCISAFEIKVYLDGNLVATYMVQGTSYPGAEYDHKSVGPIVLSPAAGDHTLTYTLQNKLNNPAVTFYPQLLILAN